MPNWTRFTSLYGAEESAMQAFMNAILFFVIQFFLEITPLKFYFPILTVLSNV